MAAAIAGLGAVEVEDLVTGAGGVAAAVRTEADWRASPAGQAVAAARLVEGSLHPGRGVGRRVQHRRRAAAAPDRRDAARVGDQGARPHPGHRRAGGHPLPGRARRRRAQAGPAARVPELRRQSYDQLLGKRSALLDFGTPGGSARLHELLAGADVLVHGYRPHALDRFGLAPQALAERHPGLVVVSLSAWGRNGPWGERRGFDSIVQAASGIAVIESPDGERPGALPCQLLDHGTGYLCAATVLRGLAAQATWGGTLFRELSLARTGHWLLSQPRAAAAAAAAAASDPAAWLTTVAARTDRSP